MQQHLKQEGERHYLCIGTGEPWKSFSSLSSSEGARLWEERVVCAGRRLHSIQLFAATIPKWRICKFGDFIAWSKVLWSQSGWRSGETVNCWQGFHFPSWWCLDSEGFTKDPKRKLKASFFLIFAYYRNRFQTKEKEVLEAAVTRFQVTYTELLIWPLLRRWKISSQHSFVGA